METVGRWHKDFLKNIRIYESAGFSPDEANNFLLKFLKLSQGTPLPKVMDTFKDPALFEESGVYTERNETISDFMMKFLSPVMKNFTVEGAENLEKIKDLPGKFPVTLISNHLSHLDAPAIYQLIYNTGKTGKELAEKFVFIAGRLAFEPDFTRLGLYMFGTLLVCSKKDMGSNPSLSDIMTKINMRSFRASQKLQSQGKIICIFPEGTRSRDGRLIEFVDTVYHYVGNKIILPIALEGTDDILPTTGFILNQAKGKLVIGNPVLIGKLPKKLMDELPDSIERIEMPEGADQKQFVIDNLALLVGKNLSKHKHGIYRNLYNGDVIDPNKNVLINLPQKKSESIAIIGSSKMSTAIASVLSNKEVDITIYDIDQDAADNSQREKRDLKNFPIYKLPPNISFSANPDYLSEATLIINGINSWEMDKYLNYNLSVKPGTPVVTISKGFTDSSTGLITDKLIEKFGVSAESIAVAAGATYPEQIMERKISGLEIAATNPELNNRLLKLLRTGYLFPRLAIHPHDIKGVQLGGAIKSIYALTIGLVEGYFQSRYGGNLDNTLFHISNRFFREMVKLGTKMGGKEDTFNGLSGLTDFMLSCFGSNSTNKTTGFQLSTGAVNKTMTSGIYGLKILGEKMELDVKDFPVISAAHEVVIQKNNLDKTILKIHELLSGF